MAMTMRVVAINSPFSNLVAEEGTPVRSTAADDEAQAKIANRWPNSLSNKVVIAEIHAIIRYLGYTGGLFGVGIFVYSILTLYHTSPYLWKMICIKEVMGNIHCLDPDSVEEQRGVVGHRLLIYEEFSGEVY
ncbi:hypothetical protein F5X99DRAFT_409837 [Biscogniauxia marginata]|nr:hypothetical protein F5X99DRAFT_409837 [Biscogniauxia marginata]